MGRPEGATGEDTRNRLLNIAAILFAKDGYADVSVADIAGEAGITAAAVYHYYRSKDELFIETVCNMYDEIALAFTDAATVGGTWRESVSEVLNACTKLYREDSVLQRLGVVAAVKASQAPETYKRVSRARDRISDVFVQIMKKAVEDGEFPKNTDPELTGDLLSHLILSGMSSATHRRKSQREFKRLVLAFRLLLNIDDGR